MAPSSSIPPRPRGTRSDSTRTLEPLEAAAPDAGFTRDRAEAALTYIRPIVADVVAVYRRVIATREQLSTAAVSELGGLEAEYDALMDRLGGLVDELQQAGVELRDFEEGVVAFRGVVDEPASLIWRAGVDAADRVSHFVHLGGSIHDAAPLPAA